MATVEFRIYYIRGLQCEKRRLTDLTHFEGSKIHAWSMDLCFPSNNHGEMSWLFEIQRDDGTVYIVSVFCILYVFCFLIYY